MKTPFLLTILLSLVGICSGENHPYVNLASQAKITASSELKGQGLMASAVADGRIAPALCQHFEFFPVAKGAKSWAVNGEEAGDKGQLDFEWEHPVFVQEIIYFGRTSWLLDECFKDYELFIDDDRAPVAKGTFEKMHGGQRIVFERQQAKKLTLRFLNAHGGPNPGATEILILDEKLSDSDLVALAPGTPPAVDRGPDPVSATNVTWTRPSAGSDESMPIGNGSLLGNVWTEKNGDVRVSLAHCSAAKAPAKTVGSLRFRITPALKTSPDSFRQMLRFNYGEVVVKNIRQAEKPSYSFFIDAQRNILHLQFRSRVPVALHVSFDDEKNNDSISQGAKRIIKTNAGNALVVLCEEMNAENKRLHAGEPRTAYDLQVHLATAKENEKPEQLAQSVAKVDVNGAVTAQVQAWNKFWNRGSIFLSGIENGAAISSALVLRRYLSACSGRGPHSLLPTVTKEIQIAESEITYWPDQRSKQAISNALELAKPLLQPDSGASRFPGFWGSDFSRMPPAKNGWDTFVSSLGSMLIEPTGKRVCVLPGWPVEHDIAFRIDSITGLGVEVVYQGGEIKRLEVYPKQRTSEVFGVGPYKEMVRDALPGPFRMPAMISFLAPSWVGPRVGLDNLFITMKKANFNGLEGSLADFEKSKEAGIYMLLHGVTPWTAHALKEEKTLISYYMSDRRKPSSFPHFGTMRQQFEAIDPYHPTEFTTYSQYGGMEFFLDAVRPRMLEYYDYHWQRQAHLHFHFLEYYRRMSIAAGGIPVFRFVHVHGDNVIKMRQTVAMSLAYGIKAFKWWVGWTMFDIHKVIETEPPPLSDIGREVSGINNTIAAFSPSLTHARSSAVYHTDPLPTGTTKPPAGYWVQPQGEHIAMGVFEGTAGEHFIVLGNRDIAARHEVKLNFPGKVKTIRHMNKAKRSWEEKKLVTNPGNTLFRMELDKGDAELIQVMLEKQDN
ncbi:MAG: hypothetical protein GY899_11570 [Verrucomicrobiaceae bacterium]|nr:hypothetical protein [Verrucomicrobiaceae bacterium]